MNMHIQTGVKLFEDRRFWDGKKKEKYQQSIYNVVYLKKIIFTNFEHGWEQSGFPLLKKQNQTESVPFLTHYFPEMFSVTLMMNLG